MTVEQERLSEILIAALKLAKEGWPVFPCNPLDKRPLCTHGFKDATIDEEIIRQWWFQWPNAMIGVPMGEISKVFCIDLDRKEGGADGVATWHELMGEHGPCPDTRTHTTPSTGMHLVFHWETGIRNIPLNKLAPGIEIKGEGGYIVVPPSRMSNGKEYIGNGMPVAYPPSWFMQMMRDYWGDGGELDEELRRDAGKGIHAEAGYEKKPTDIEEVRAALRHISSDEYEIWFRVAGALFREIGNTGFWLFDDWSKKSNKYSSRDVKRKWKDASKITNISAGTIYHMAEEQAPGWREAYHRSQQYQQKQKTSSNTGAQQSQQQTTYKFPQLDISGWTRKNLPEQEWAIPGRVPLRSVCLFSGEGSAGKSLIQLQLSVAHCLGKQWMDVMPKQGPVMFIDAEDPADVMQRRLLDILDYYDASMKDIINLLHITSLIGQDAVLAHYSYKSGVMQKTQLYDRLYEMAGDLKPVMIGIASSADVFAGNEIDRSQVRQFIALLTRIAMVANGSVSLLSHPSLTGMQNDSGISGNTAWHNSVRARMYLKSITAEGSNLRELQFKKNNYGPIAASMIVQWERGLFLPVNMGGTSSKVDITRQIFIALLSRYAQEGRPSVNSKNGRSYAPALFAREPEAKEAGIKKEALEDCMLMLLKDKVVLEEEYIINGRAQFRLVVSAKYQNQQQNSTTEQDLPF